MALESGVVGGGSERKTESSSGDDMGVGGYIGGNRRCDDPRRRFGIDRGVCEAVDEEACEAACGSQAFRPISHTLS